MNSLLADFGFEIPLALILMALFALRMKVLPRASLYINARPETVFKLIDLYDGKLEDWGRVKISSDLIDAGQGIFKKTYHTTLSSGVKKTVYALFSIRERKADERLEIVREGLVGKSLNNELLSQSFQITQEGQGCRLSVQYEWGPRPIIAQLVGRADLWGGIFRLRGLAERGVAMEWPYALITIGVSVVTGILSLVTFALLMGWTMSALLVFALFIHELGHLLAYRMMGQPWGRMIFLPFLGAIAMPRFPFDTQGQMVFAALMGPGFSILLALACAVQLFLGGEVSPIVASLGWVACLLNIFNLLPAEPLDGGIALRSVLGRYMGKAARFGLMGVGVLLVVIGFALTQILLVVFGVLAIVFNIRQRTIDAGLAPLMRTQVVLAFVCYVNMVAVYSTLMQFYGPLLKQLQNSG
jgi:Zn-dependent protease